MASVDVMTTNAGKGGTLELDPAVFEVEVKPHLFHAEVRRQLAARRAGTHSTRNRSGVSGGGAKPYRQKGTGRARQGSTRAPQYAGGGAVFGPVPRGHSHRLNKKVRAAALRSALSLRLAEGDLTVVEGLELGEFKTRKLIEALGAVGLEGHSVLVVLDAADEHVERSGRNLPHVSVIRAEGLNVYDVLRHGKLLLTRGAAERVQERLGRRSEGAA